MLSSERAYRDPRSWLKGDAEPDTKAYTEALYAGRKY